MLRQDIIDKIGREFYSYTIDSEEGEFLYKKEFELIGKDWDSIKIRNTFKKNESYYMDLDIRFVNPEKNLSICVETKGDYKKSKKEFEKVKEQLDAYMHYEKVYTGNTVIGILANTTYNDIVMYKDSVSESNKIDFDVIQTMSDLVEFLFPSVKNSKEDVMTATYRLNEILHGYGVEAKIRGQFVGTCLLALKNGLVYEDNGIAKRTPGIIADIKDILGELLDKSLNKAEKLTLLSKNVLDNEKVKKLSNDNLNEVLNHIKTKILPFINDDTTAGQDILNLFFTMFNKYVDKDDKNQAFTPDHITDFMCKITGVDHNSRVLDPCCGSGAFLVRALVTARNSCSKLPNRESLIDEINKHKIFGIEYSEKPYGLSTTNMLIHGDGNTNVIKANCFDQKEWIMREVKPTIILMNPPYNAQQIVFPKEIIDHTEKIKNKQGKTKNVKILKTYCTGAWPKTKGKPAKEDPTKGLCFVDYISDCLFEADITNVKLAVLLPLQCAIGDKGLILRAKENILKHNTLDAVFTLPPDVFHPGASSSACCMLFTMGNPHCDTNGIPKKKTFFGYYKEDGFIKKKKLGRVEKLNKQGESIWKTYIEPKWLDLFNNADIEVGFSSKEKVTAYDEWLCEAYMQTDYSNLSRNDFLKTINDFLAYLLKGKKFWNWMDEYIKSSHNNPFIKDTISKKIEFNTDGWKEFKISRLTNQSGLFEIEQCKCSSAGSLDDGDEINYIGAKKNDNGVMRRVIFDKDLVSKGNGIMFICDGEGSVGYSNYMDEDFIGSTTTSIGYDEQLNMYNSLFIVTILDQEKFKFSYGRKYRAHINDITIKLPVKCDENRNPLIDNTHKYSETGFVPDWVFMEEFIKSSIYDDIVKPYQ